MMRFALSLALVPTAIGAAATERLQTSRPVVAFGQGVVLSGKFDHGLAHVPVTLFSKEHGKTSYTSTALLTTANGGRWTVNVQPTIGTSYEAASLAERTSPLTIGVRPRVTLLRRGGRFAARVLSTLSYEQRFVFLQRRTSGGWITVTRLVLSTKPRTFEVRLPRGVSHVRIFLPRSQAGAGYLPSFSSTVVVRR